MIDELDGKGFWQALSAVRTLFLFTGNEILEGGIVILKNIFFETDSHMLKYESRFELNKLVKFLKDNPGIMIEISGHTDNTGSTEYNLTLSKKRAKSVYDYLIDNSIRAGRLIYTGYGEKYPIDSNDTEKGKALNRRTEFNALPFSVSFESIGYWKRQSIKFSSSI